MKQVAIAVDQLINTLLGGMADETLSARAWRNRHRHGASKIIDALFFWQGNHCEQAYFSELERKQLPAEYAHD